jgi:hypothetical protein
MSELTHDEISELWTDGNGEGVLDGERDRRVVMSLVLRCPRDVVMGIYLFAPHAALAIGHGEEEDDEDIDPTWALPPLSSIDPTDCY